jgi:hypothetical protein
VAQEFIENMVSNADSRNYRLFSDSMLKVYKSSGLSDSNRYAKHVQSLEGWIDSAKVLRVSFLSPDRAKVFVKEFGPDTSTSVYNFVKESSGWKVNGFD